jgi:uncharacterized RmlC-like cupin family protein
MLTNANSPTAGGPSYIEGTFNVGDSTKEAYVQARAEHYIEKMHSAIIAAENARDEAIGAIVRLRARDLQLQAGAHYHLPLTDEAIQMVEADAEEKFYEIEENLMVRHDGSLLYDHGSRSHQPLGLAMATMSLLISMSHWNHQNQILIRQICF